MVLRLGRKKTLEIDGFIEMTRSTIQDFIGSAYNYLQAKIKKETDSRELQKLRRGSKYLKLALLSLND